MCDIKTMNIQKQDKNKAKTCFKSKNSILSVLPMCTIAIKLDLVGFFFFLAPRGLFGGVIRLWQGRRLGLGGVGVHYID